ncbi:hypothetical protein V6N11_056375 [Hibiscus sabdariffa]|uniref:Protein kinase domain-containing protein n=1 Tax=Hibiscus sabdariffa TaxID=183260 RepID=A0ABR2T4G0_9ROSI
MQMNLKRGDSEANCAGVKDTPSSTMLTCCGLLLFFLWRRSGAVYHMNRDLWLDKILQGLVYIHQETFSHPIYWCTVSPMGRRDQDLRLHGVIGKGSGGVVQLVRHKWQGNSFALKVFVQVSMAITCNQIPGKIFIFFVLVQFDGHADEHEKKHQAVKCSHAVVCYHSFNHGGTVYLVLQHMDRGSLADVVRQVNTIAEPYLAAISKQIGKVVSVVMKFGRQFFKILHQINCRSETINLDRVLVHLALFGMSCFEIFKVWRF